MAEKSNRSGRREHTPVWQVIMSVRPRLKAIVNLTPKSSEPGTLTFWAKRISAEMAIVPLKLLHLLLVGYRPEQKRPVIRWAKTSNRKT